MFRRLRLGIRAQARRLVREWHLGIIAKDGKIVNHRSVLTVFLNPILTKIGIVISTKVRNQVFLERGIHIGVCWPTLRETWEKDYGDDYDHIIRERLWY